MELAQRAYLYSLLHVAFGAEPTQDSLRAMACDQTVDVLMGLAGGCAAIAKDIDAEASEAADALTALGKQLQLTAERIDDAAFVDALRSAYAKLFEIPGADYVHPWESPYTGKQNMVFQESTLDVRAFYHEAGYQLRAERKFPDDHIAAMMDYLGRTGQQAYDAFADGDDEAAARILAAQLRFLDAHVLSWATAFSSEVSAHDENGWYAAFARAMAAYARIDRAWLAQCAEVAKA